MLAGRYVLGERLGGGGMGVVYAAHDEKLDRRVALKLLRPDAGGTEEAHRQLVREAQTLARLAHPNVVNVHAIGDLQGRVYVEMELVKGATLGQWLRGGTRTWQEVLAMFLQAGAGLAAAHAVGIVHRDFKPDNVLVGDDGRVRVADFGIALLGPPTASPDSSEAMEATRHGSPRGDDEESETSRSHSRLIAGSGTPGYMAPEQKAGLDVDHRSDQYSFCVALFESLHGVRPREAKLGIASDEDLAPPAWLDAAIERGLSFDAAERFPSMEALLGVLASEPRRRFRRRRALFAAAAAVALLGAGVASGSAARSRQLCRGSEEKLVGVWDHGRKSAIEQAFLGSGKPFASDAWRGVEKTLDAYAHDWTSTRTEACEATRVRGEQSDQILGMRMACLDDRLDAMSALTNAFLRADEKVVAKAFEATQALPALAGCSDVKHLRLASRGEPQDPQLAGKRAELRSGMAQAKALDDLGKYREALPLAREHSTEAARLGDKGLQAAALYREGKLLGRTGDLAGAEQTLRRSAALADAAGDDALRVRAISGLLFFIAGDAMKVDQIAALEEQAKGALARLGGDEEVEGNFLMGLGNALGAAGKNAEALDVDERAAALEARLHGEDSWQAGVVLVNLGNTLANQGDTKRAIETEERALAIVARDLGPSHPSVADAEATIGISLYGEDQAPLGEPHMRRAVAITDGQVGAEEFVAYLYGLGDILLAQGKYEEAFEQFQRAYDLLAPHHPAADPLLRTSLTGMGDIRVSQGRSREAIAYLERALALPSDGDESTEARAKFALARALTLASSKKVNRGDSRTRARTLATEAKATLDQGATIPGDAARLHALEEWLLKNP